LTSEPELQLRNYEWSDINALSDLLNDAAAHGHRDWPESVEGLRADLEYPRVQPEKNLVLVEFTGETETELAGYAIVEPEQNIGRSVIGLACIAAENREAITGMLLDWATRRAAEFTPLAHLATRDHETGLSGYVERNGWKQVRSYLRLENGPHPTVVGGVVPAGFGVRTMLGLDELAELTNLQNESFKAHFGFSPNTVDEVKAKLLARGASIDDVVMIHDSNERLVAYCWTQTYERAGSKIGRIGMTGVLPDARGLGLGRAIAKAGFNHLLAQDVSAIELEVDSANAPAVKIYSSLGFTTKSEINWWEKGL